MRLATYVSIGFGEVAKIHHAKFRHLNIDMVGVIEANPLRQVTLTREGYRVLDSYATALEYRPTFWDICVDTRNHVNVLEHILQVDPRANVIIEKPICLHSEIPRLRKLLKEHPESKVLVNENYNCSEVTSTLKRIAFDELKLCPSKIVVEMTKNRTTDFGNGRFLDHELAVLGYEGSHMISIIRDLGKDFLPNDFREVDFNDLDLGQQKLCDQGCARMQYHTQCGVEVDLYTSMDGRIHYHLPWFSRKITALIDKKSNLKHRILAIEGVDQDGAPCTVVGIYEPIKHFERSLGLVITLRKGLISNLSSSIGDDTMCTNLKRAVDFFVHGIKIGVEDADTAIHTVEILKEARSFRRKPENFNVSMELNR